MSSRNHPIDRAPVLQALNLAGQPSEQIQTALNTFIDGWRRTDDSTRRKSAHSLVNMRYPGIQGRAMEQNVGRTMSAVQLADTESDAFSSVRSLGSERGPGSMGGLSETGAQSTRSSLSPHANMSAAGSVSSDGQAIVRPARSLSGRPGGFDGPAHLAHEAEDGLQGHGDHGANVSRPPAPVSVALDQTETTDGHERTSQATLLLSPLLALLLLYSWWCHVNACDFAYIRARQMKMFGM